MNPVERKGILKNRTFEIRPLAHDEAELLCDAVRASISEIGTWENWCIPGFGTSEARAHLELAETQWHAAHAYKFNVLERASGLVVGSISINQIDQVNRRGNVGYWTRSSHRGLGIAPLAVQTVARFGFATLGMVRLEIVAQEANRNSRRVAEKVGARLECVARNRLVYHGEPRAAAVYSLLTTDLRRSRPSPAPRVA